MGFLNAIAQALLSRAHLQLNTKHLYAANGIAAKELLKLATVLYKAQRAAEDIVPNNNDVDYPIPCTTQACASKRLNYNACLSYHYFFLHKFDILPCSWPFRCVILTKQVNWQWE